MIIKNPGLRVLAEGCALDAVKRWERREVRIANQHVFLDGEHMEWLTIYRPDGAIKVLQHFPCPRIIGVFTPVEVQRLIRRSASRFTPRAIRGHLRSETRRQR